MCVNCLEKTLTYEKYMIANFISIAVSLKPLMATYVFIHSFTKHVLGLQRDMQRWTFSLGDCRYTERKSLQQHNSRFCLHQQMPKEKELQSQGIQCQFLAAAGTRHSHGAHSQAYV